MLDVGQLYLTIYSIPNMKNARHFLPYPNQCISSFQFSVMGRMAGQWPVLSSFLHWYQNGGLKAGDSYTCGLINVQLKTLIK